MPAGVHIRDPCQHLFAAAENLLLQDGPRALTTRAVTDEAGCAKGVLHRHFTDFDAFLAELVLDRAAQLDDHGLALRESTGAGTVANNLTHLLTALCSSVGAIIPLITSRDAVRAHVRRARPGRGIPILTDAAVTIRSYLVDERQLGRIAADADVDSLALSLVGGAHLLFAGQDSPDAGAIGGLVTSVTADVVRRRPR